MFTLLAFASSAETLSLVVDDPISDILKQSFVGGTCGGFYMAFITSRTRPQPTIALLQFDTNGLAKIAVPQPQVRFNCRMVTASLAGVPRLPLVIQAPATNVIQYFVLFMNFVVHELFRLK